MRLKQGYISPRCRHKQLFILVLYIIISYNFSFGQIENIQIQLDKILSRDVAISFDETPGFIIGLIDRDSSWIISRGHLVNQQDTIPTNSIFELVGLSKVFTNFCAYNLAFQDQLDLSQTIGAILDDAHYPSALRNVTIDQVINHQTGIPKHLLLNTKGMALDSLSILSTHSFLMDLKKADIATDQHFQYSHHNYALLQILMENSISQDMISILNNCYSSSIQSYDPHLFSEDLEPIAGLSRAGRTSSYIDADAYQSSIGLLANMPQLVSIVQKQFIPFYKEQIQQEHYPLNKTGIQRRTQFYMGWYALKLNKKRFIMSHSGQNQRHKVSIMMVPDTETAVIILSNSEIGTQDLSLHLLRMLNYNWKRKVKDDE